MNALIYSQLHCIFILEISILSSWPKKYDPKNIVSIIPREGTTFLCKRGQLVEHTMYRSYSNYKKPIKIKKIL